MLLPKIHPRLLIPSIHLIVGENSTGCLPRPTSPWTGACTHTDAHPHAHTHTLPIYTILAEQWPDFQLILYHVKTLGPGLALGLQLVHSLSCCLAFALLGPTALDQPSLSIAISTILQSQFEIHLFLRFSLCLLSCSLSFQTAWY